MKTLAQEYPPGTGSYKAEKNSAKHKNSEPEDIETLNKLLIQGFLQALILQSRNYLRNIKSARPS
jgi:hypothetical protein